MNRIAKIGPLELGAGQPKIIAPLTGADETQLLEQACHCQKSPADIAEWRADFYAHIHDSGRVAATLAALREALGAKPLIFTCRTEQEGGAIRLNAAQYAELYCLAAQSGLAEAVDVQAFTGEAVNIIKDVRQTPCAVIASWHNFFTTPPAEDILDRLRHMQCMDADILKIAVMPRNRADVMQLLQASLQFFQEAKKPYIIISMEELGKISRLGAGFLGAAATYGRLRQGSAPGQLPVEVLKKIF